MSKAPPSPSFRPPQNRLKSVLPRLNALSLSDVPTPPPTKDEISPVVPLDPPSIVIESEIPRATPLKPPTPPKATDAKRKSLPPDDDIHSLDEEGWARVAKAGGIEELLVLGEGVSGSVSKCRFRKSGQVFAIKVISLCDFAKVDCYH
jgi:hypothetical protein